MSEDTRPLAVPGPDFDEHGVARALWAFADARRRTVAAIAALPDAAVDWIPPEGSHTIGALLYHIAATEAEWVCLDLQGLANLPDELRQLFADGVRNAAGRLAVPNGESLADHLRRLETVRAYALSVLCALDACEFQRPRLMAFASRSATPEWVVHHLNQHEAEHRGQVARLQRRAAEAVASRAERRDDGYRLIRNDG